VARLEAPGAVEHATLLNRAPFLLALTLSRGLHLTTLRLRRCRHPSELGARTPSFGERSDPLDGHAGTLIAAVVPGGQRVGEVLVYPAVTGEHGVGGTDSNTV
jgi:hypothetical protein